MDLKVRKIQCTHCNGTGQVEDNLWVVIFMGNGTKECLDCSGRGYQIVKNGISYKDYDGTYENEKTENIYEQLYKRS